MFRECDKTYKYNKDGKPNFSNRKYNLCSSKVTTKNEENIFERPSKIIDQFCKSRMFVKRRDVVISSQ